MSDNVKCERLSALMDGELEEFEVRAAIRDLMAEGDLRRRWQGYHLLSDVLGGHLPDTPTLGLLERVNQSLDAIEEEDSAAVAPDADGAGRGFVRPAAGFALAASVAVAAVLGIRALGGPDPVPALAVNDPVGSAVVDPQVASLRWAPSRADGADRFNGYLVDHSASAHGMTLTLPYVRVVSYDGAR